MNKQVEKYTKLIKSNTTVLEGNYKVKSLGIFGSVVRSEQTEKSDVDILVEFSEPVGFFLYNDLKYFLNKILQHKVDLVTKRALDQNEERRPGIKDRVLKEVKLVL